MLAQTPIPDIGAISARKYLNPFACEGFRPLYHESGVLACD